MLRGRTCSRHGCKKDLVQSSKTVERVTIRHPRSCHGAGPSRVTAARAAVQLMILGAGGGDPQPRPFVRLARSEPLRNRRRARGPDPVSQAADERSHGPIYGNCPGGARPREKSRRVGCRTEAQPAGQGAQELAALHGADKQMLPGDASTESAGIWGRAWASGLGEPVCRVSSLFSLPTLSSCFSCFFFQLCCAAHRSSQSGTEAG